MLGAGLTTPRFRGKIEPQPGDPVGQNSDATSQELAREVELLRRRIGELEAEAPSGQGQRSLDRWLRFTQFAVDNLSDAAYWMEEDARIIYVNDAACRLLGYTKDELLAIRVYDLNADTDRSQWSEIWARLKQARRRIFEGRHRAKNGRIIPVEIAANFLEFDGREYSCAFVRDITERKQLEVRLRQAEKMEAVGRLAGGVAHDFNNQLAGIMGYADLLQQSVDPDSEAAEFAAGILQAAARASELTAQLLAFSRKGKYVLGPVDLHGVIAEVCEMLSRSMDKRICIEHHLSAAQPLVMGDASQIHNAILNLALNARDAMPDGGTMTFSTENVELDPTQAFTPTFQSLSGPHVRLCVSDTGVGISEEIRDQIFEPFYTTKEQGKGTGLGLAAVYGTVKNHKGGIRIHSVKGTGTVAEICLPLLEEAPSAATKTPTASDPPRLTAGHVLVVEDDPTLRDIATTMLRSLGCTVTAVENGRAAIEYYATAYAHVDLVLLDMIMPLMSGRETFAEMQKVNPHVQVLLSSGYSLDGDARAVLDAGARGFIQKPYRRQALARILSEVLGDHAG